MPKATKLVGKMCYNLQFDRRINNPDWSRRRCRFFQQGLPFREWPKEANRICLAASNVICLWYSFPKHGFTFKKKVINVSFIKNDAAILSKDIFSLPNRVIIYLNQIHRCQPLGPVHTFSDVDCFPKCQATSHWNRNVSKC